VSYDAIVAGLGVRYATISGIKAILDYEPKTVSNPPIIYTLLDTVTRSQAGQVTVMDYRILSRLCIRWQDNEYAERELRPYVNALPASIDADPKLGGAIPSGMAAVTDIQAVFVTINGVLLRCLDMYVRVVEKAPYGSGI
jgi:hypothetical protein